MDLEQYQQAILQTDKMQGLGGWYYALKLNGEAGEVAEIIGKDCRPEPWRVPLSLDDLVEELGDVLWYVARLSAFHGVSLEEVARRNIVKIERRCQERGSCG